MINLLKVLFFCMIMISCSENDKDVQRLLQNSSSEFESMNTVCITGFKSISDGIALHTSENRSNGGRNYVGFNLLECKTKDEIAAALGISAAIMRIAAYSCLATGVGAGVVPVLKTGADGLAIAAVFTTNLKCVDTVSEDAKDQIKKELCNQFAAAGVHCDDPLKDTWKAMSPTIIKHPDDASESSYIKGITFFPLPPEPFLVKAQGMASVEVINCFADACHDMPIMMLFSRSGSSIRLFVTDGNVTVLDFNFQFIFNAQFDEIGVTLLSQSAPIMAPSNDLYVKAIASLKGLQR